LYHGSAEFVELASIVTSRDDAPPSALNPDDLRFAIIRLLKIMTVVEIESVTKTFGQHVAVNRLSLSVPRGSIYGFIGPNGSGKTTTLRMIMRIYHPDPGTGVIRVLGEANSAAANDRVGYLPEERGLYKKMTCVKFFASTRN
jgi:ABC-type uncharacterized transport system ATPase subunit